MNVSPAFASILRSGRSDFNARFAAARRVHPDLDAAAFSEFLRTSGNELVQPIERIRPDQLAEVINAVFDAGLELVGQKLVGNPARALGLERAWREVLPAAASLVAAAPDRLIAAVCNATHQLRVTPGARPEQWIETMSRLAPECSDVDTFLKVGQVAAWRAGLAHFRESALEVAGSLPEKLALGALGSKPGASWAAVQSRLLANPWFDPACVEERKPELRIVARVGSFRGFGGLFVEPPRLLLSGRHFLVRSGDDYWLLAADAFGATFHRASEEEYRQASTIPPLPPSVRVDRSGITLNGRLLELPPMGSVTSAAANETTLAVTTQWSHAILLLALPER